MATWQINPPYSISKYKSLANTIKRHLIFSQMMALTIYMYGQYDSRHSYMSVAAGHAYGYTRGQYSTGLLGTSDWCKDTYDVD